MILNLKRRPSDDHRTHGDLYIDGEWQCHTLEDVVREDPNPSTPHNEAKIHGQTAIPSGRYRVTFENSPRFGPETLTLHDVPGFTHIRIHAGNTEKDTEGCILVGKIRANASILHSRVALEELKNVVAEAMDRGELVWMEIEHG